jgi:hypothetical protein
VIYLKLESLTIKNNTFLYFSLASLITWFIFSHGCAHVAQKSRTEIFSKSLERTSLNCSGELMVMRLLDIVWVTGRCRKDEERVECISKTSKSPRGKPRRESSHVCVIHRVYALLMSLNLFRRYITDCHAAPFTISGALGPLNKPLQDVCSSTNRNCV